MQSIQFDRVADLYDTYVRVDFDVPYFLREAGEARGKVLELMCGTGRLSIPLLRAGIDLTCVDYSQGMLAVLCRKLDDNRLSAPIIAMDAAELSLPDRYALIFIAFNSFSEILDKSKQRQALWRISEHLLPDGEFICTLHNPAIRIQSMDGSLKHLGDFSMETGGSLIVRSQLTYDPISQIASGEQLYELRDPTKELIETRSLPISFYLFSKTEFEDLACSVGLEVVELLGNYDGSRFSETESPYMIWKLRKAEAPAGTIMQ